MAILGMLKKGRSVVAPLSDTLRPMTEEMLREFMERTKAASMPRQVQRFADRRAVANLLREYDRRLEAALESFDAGLLDLSEPAHAPASMSINIGGDMIGSAIQQGSPSASQQVQLNATNAFSALEAYESAVRASGMPKKQANAIAAPLELLKDEIRKTEPDVGVIRQIGQSVRTIAESVVASGISSALAPVANKLWTALGIG